MGNGMNRILPGLYVGNFQDAKDPDQLKKNNITHILSIHNYGKKKSDPAIQYLLIDANDSPDQDLTQFFSQCNDFIHQARISSGNVLVHCLAGMSRSVTITAAYMMTVTSLTWKESINAIRGARTSANPNFGFQKQLQKFAAEDLQQEKERLSTSFEPSPYDDARECRALLKSFEQFVLFGDRKEKSDGLYPLPYKCYGDKDKVDNWRKGVVGGLSLGLNNDTGTSASGTSSSEHRPNDNTETIIDKNSEKESNDKENYKQQETDNSNQQETENDNQRDTENSNLDEAEIGNQQRTENDNPQETEKCEKKLSGSDTRSLENQTENSGIDISDNANLS